MAGYYSEAEFTAPSLAPPEGTIWMWFDYQVGRAGWAKIPHEDNNSLSLGKAIRSLNEFYLQLTNPRAVDGRILPSSNQKWVINSIKPYPDYNYTLFKLEVDISSEAVSADEAGTSGGAGFAFRVTGDEAFAATGSDGELLSGYKTAVPQGFFPTTDNHPTEQTFRGYRGANYFTEYQVFSNIGGTLNDPGNQFKNGQTEINNAFLSSITSKAPANRVPWFMNDSFRAITIDEAAITDLTPEERVELFQIAGFYISNTGLGRNESVQSICRNGDFDVLGSQKFAIVSASPLLEVENGKLKFKNESNGTFVATEEPLRQKDGSVSFNTQSIIKNGAFPTLSDGNYAIKVGSNGGTVRNSEKVITVQNQRIVGVYHCPNQTKVILPEFSFLPDIPPDVGGSDLAQTQGAIGDTVGVRFAHLYTNNPLLSEFGAKGRNASFVNLVSANNSVRYNAGRAIQSSTTNQSIGLGYFYITQVNNQYRAHIGLVDANRRNIGPKAGSYSFRLNGYELNSTITFSVVMNINGLLTETPPQGVVLSQYTENSHPLRGYQPYTLTITSQPR